MLESKPSISEIKYIMVIIYNEKNIIGRFINRNSL